MISEQINKLVQRFESANDCGKISVVVDSKSLGVIEKNSESLTLVASVTKMFTSALTLLLVEQNRIGLDDSLGKYLTDAELLGLNNFGGKDRSSSLVVKNLLRQDSGIPNYYLGKKPEPGADLARRIAEDPGWSFLEALELAKTYPSPFAPGGNKVQYSFTNYQILSEVLERVEGKPLAELISSHITQPLKLASTELLTHSNLDLFNRSEQILYGKQLYQGARRMASLRGEGAVVSSTRDVIQFMKSLFAGELISRGSLESMNSGAKPMGPLIRYGLGTMHIRLPGLLVGRLKPVELIGHFGASSSFAFYLPEFDTYLAGTLNQMASPLLAPKFVTSLARIVVKHSGKS